MECGEFSSESMGKKKILKLNIKMIKDVGLLIGLNIIEQKQGRC